MVCQTSMAIKCILLMAWGEPRHPGLVRRAWGQPVGYAAAHIWCGAWRLCSWQSRCHHRRSILPLSITVNYSLEVILFLSNTAGLVCFLGANVLLCACFCEMRGMVWELRPWVGNFATNFLCLKLVVCPQTRSRIYTCFCSLQLPRALLLLYMAMCCGPCPSIFFYAII
jgi:hypothetical protein